MKLLALIFAVIATPAFSANLEVQPISDNIYALIGSLGQRNPDNLGNNSTFGVVLTLEGVVLIDAGGSWQGAADIDAMIDTITDQPVKVVINTGGQDHRWLGNDYWRTQGATIITSNAARLDQENRFEEQMLGLSQFLGDAVAGTEAAYADVTFEDNYKFEFGDVQMQIVHSGAAHTPGDSFVWLPEFNVVFAGDIVFNERILGVQAYSTVKDWIASFEALASFQPQWVVPGHGRAGTLDIATKDTYDYLRNLRQNIGEHIDNGGGIIEAVKIDQSEFEYLQNFEVWAGRNAQQTYEQMEWE